MLDFNIKTSGVGVNAATLSGGNQQKAVLASEFQRNPKILIASQPTRGLDVGAIEFVHERIMDAKKEHKAILLVSLELSEIMNLSETNFSGFCNSIYSIPTSLNSSLKESSAYFLYVTNLFIFELAIIFAHNMQGE